MQQPNLEIVSKKYGLPIKIDLPEGFLDEEIRCDYTVTKERKELWAVELDLLAELDRVCKENGIQYLAVQGTLLGAIRHQGFIPWDDDIDIMMTWENYKKFREIAPTAFEYPYFYQDGYTDSGSIRGHGQFRNSETTAFLASGADKKHLFNQGIFLDVFPIDHLPDDQKKKKIFLNKIKRYRKSTSWASNLTYRFTDAAQSKRNILKACAIKFLHPFAMKMHLEEKTFKRYETTLHQYNEIVTEKAGVLSLPPLRDWCHWYCEDLYGNIEYVPFEFTKIPIPQNYERILATQYGDWHEHVVGSSIHGDLIIDTRKSYREYLK